MSYYFRFKAYVKIRDSQKKVTSHVGLHTNKTYSVCISIATVDYPRYRMIKKTEKQDEEKREIHIFI